MNVICIGDKIKTIQLDIQMARYLRNYWVFYIPLSGHHICYDRKSVITDSKTISLRTILHKIQVFWCHSKYKME